jgi:hypothetical protein
MAYTPINWQTGDTITAEKMNKMDNGWSVSSSATTLCDETVTTVDDGGMYDGQLSISSITSPTITVTYDGTPYQCTQDGDGGYGDDPNFTFSDYPFRIESDGFIVTQTGGAHTVKIEATVTSVETSDQFADAVASVIPVFQITIEVTAWQEAHDAMASGKLCYYTASVDGDEVLQFVALKAIYNTEQERYDIIAVGAPSDGLAVKDVLYAFSSTDALVRN